MHGLAVTPLGHASWMRPRDELLERGEPLALGIAENERGVVVNGRLCVVAMTEILLGGARHYLVLIKDCSCALPSIVQIPSLLTRSENSAARSR